MPDFTLANSFLNLDLNPPSLGVEPTQSLSNSPYMCFGFLCLGIYFAGKSSIVWPIFRIARQYVDLRAFEFALSPRVIESKIAFLLSEFGCFSSQLLMSEMRLSQFSFFIVPTNRLSCISLLNQISAWLCTWVHVVYYALPWALLQEIRTHGMLKGVRVNCSNYSMNTPAPMIQINSMRIMPTASALKNKANTIRMPRSSVLL